MDTNYIAEYIYGKNGEGLWAFYMAQFSKLHPAIQVLPSQA